MLAASSLRAALGRLRPEPSIKQDILGAGALGLGGDLVCQFGVERRAWRDFEPRRALAIVVFNTVYIGGFLHYLYRAYPAVVAGVGRAVGRPALARPTATAHRVGCSLVDNAHCGLIYIPVYFLGVAGLSGEDAGEAEAARFGRVRCLSSSARTGVPSARAGAPRGVGDDARPRGLDVDVETRRTTSSFERNRCRPDERGETSAKVEESRDAGEGT